jgi:hypothetical protein
MITRSILPSHGPVIGSSCAKINNSETKMIIELVEFEYLFTMRAHSKQYWVLIIAEYLKEITFYSQGD